MISSCAAARDKGTSSPKLIQVGIVNGIETALITWDSRFFAAAGSPLPPDEWVASGFPEIPFSGTLRFCGTTRTTSN